LAALALGLVAGSASAQNDVTFQVDLNPYITTCQFVPDDNGVLLRGSFNGFDESTALADDDDNGIYETTLSLAEGVIEYKFFVSNSSVLSWENDVTDDGGTTNNRDYTVVAGAQTLDVVTFNGPAPEDNCSAMTMDYEITFTADMSVQVARGAFDPATQVPGVAGAITDWGNSPVALQPDPFLDNVYTGLLTEDQNGNPISLSTPGTSPYKFVILNTSDNSIAAWESGDDRLIEVTGNEPDADSDGLLEATVASRFFNDVTADQVLQQETTVTYQVDLSSAAFYLADNGSIPGTPEAVTEITGLFINGPAAWESIAGGGPGGGITDWIAWGETGLATFDDFSFSDDDDDDVWELELTYPAGALTTLVGKLGINGADNEAGFGNDSFYPVADGNTFTGNGTTIELVFGATIKPDGTYVDSIGPDADGDGNADPIYDPYILVDNTATPPTVTAVDGTGEIDVAIEGGPALASGVALSAPRPNPSAGQTSIVLSLGRGMTVRAQVVDLMGRVVATLAEGALSAGDTTLELDASTMAAGVYVLRVEADGEVASRRMTVVR
jgi:hypothetical protein